MAKEKNQDAQQKAWAKIVAKAWSDEVFKQRLLKNPDAVFQEYGLDTPEGITFKIHENSNKVIHITLPAKPEGLSDEQLKNVAAGAAASKLGFFFGVCK